MFQGIDREKICATRMPGAAVIMHDWRPVFTWVDIRRKHPAPTIRRNALRLLTPYSELQQMRLTCCRSWPTHAD
jgi:hypothetical protein